MLYPDRTMDEALPANIAIAQVGAWMEEVPRRITSTKTPPRYDAKSSNLYEGYRRAATGDLQDNHQPIGMKEMQSRSNIYSQTTDQFFRTLLTVRMQPRMNLIVWGFKNTPRSIFGYTGPQIKNWEGNHTTGDILSVAGSMADLSNVLDRRGSFSALALVFWDYASFRLKCKGPEAIAMYLLNGMGTMF